MGYNWGYTYWGIAKLTNEVFYHKVLHVALLQHFYMICEYYWNIEVLKYYFNRSSWFSLKWCFSNIEVGNSIYTTYTYIIYFLSTLHTRIRNNQYICGFLKEPSWSVIHDPRDTPGETSRAAHDYVIKPIRKTQEVWHFVERSLMAVESRHALE